MVEADELAQLAADAQRIFAVTYNYSGYPMVRQARAMIARGDIGALRVVQVEYAQAWLAGPLETTGQKQAAWRTDPARSGPGGAIGDIGSHAFHLACFVTGRVPEQILGRSRDVRCRAGGSMTTHMCCCASRVARAACCGPARWRTAMRTHCGCASMARSGGLEWAQEEPDRLWFTPSEQPRQLLTRGGPGMVPRRRGSRACPPATRKAIWRVSPPSMPRWHMRFARHARMPSRRQRSRSRLSWMAFAVFASSPHA